MQEGDTGGAMKVLEKALALNPELPRANYFYAEVCEQKASTMKRSPDCKAC